MPAPWTVADRYKLTKQSMVIVAGERQGMGSYRDWAALEAAVEIAKKLGPKELALRPRDVIKVQANPCQVA